MSLIVYPSESWEFSYKGYEGKGPYVENGVEVAYLVEDESNRQLRMNIKELPKNFKLKVYFKDPLGASIP